MTYLRLLWEFFKTGLFAIGGGMATLPFLKNIGLSTGWYSQTDLMNMLAVSESTPGPIGINMATYVGFTVCGVPGAVIATVGELTPSIIVILIVAAMLAKFRDSKLVSNALYGLRPASTGLIAAACIDVVLQVLLHVKLPLIMPAITECLFLSLLNAMKVYDLNISLTGGGPYRTSEAITMNVFQTAFTESQMGYGAAKAFIMAVVVVAMTLLQVAITSKREVQV